MPEWEKPRLRALVATLFSTVRNPEIASCTIRRGYIEDVEP
jgi:hypothetical protein